MAAYDTATNRMIVWSGDSTLVSAPGPHRRVGPDERERAGRNSRHGFRFSDRRAAAGRTFPGREFTSAVYDGITNRMIVFGGATCDPCGGRNDVWVLTNANGLGGAPAWLELFPSGEPPSGSLPQQFRHSTRPAID